MDLLYSRYASPMNFMKIYMDQGRFGEFVTEIINMDCERQREEKEKEEEDRLWNAYIHSMPDESFNDWKSGLRISAHQKPKTYSMNDNEVEAAIEKSRSILKGFHMK